MRVLEINSVCGTGSTGRIACQIADIVVQNGGEAAVAYGRNYYEKGCTVPTYRIGSNFGVYIHVGLSRITDRQGFYSKKATRKLVTYIEKYCPDVIHLHNIHGYYLHLPTLFNFLSVFDRPVVWTFHDCWAFTGHCAHFDYIGCDKWKTGCHHCPQKRRYPASYVLDQSKRNWIEKRDLFTSIRDMTIVTPSRWLAGLVKESFLQKYPVKVIHNGIDMSVFKPTQSPWKEDRGIDKPVILACAAVWDQRKGYQDILKLADLMPEYTIVIVGVSKKQISKLSENIVGIQRTEHIQELVDIYSAADVFVNTTYEDTFPTVNLEALACGTGVITYNTGGSIECIDDKNGVIVKQGDISAMKESIESTSLFWKTRLQTDFSKLISSFNHQEGYYNLYCSLGAGSASNE
jgi:glycosyltransferase involved in cell wall biosynthesis